jgi:SsrA-binding protein
VRRLLGHAAEIRKMALAMQAKGASLVPLKIYFKNGVAKLLVGVALGRKKADKRQAIKERETRRDIEREMGKRR